MVTANSNSFSSFKRLAYAHKQIELRRYLSIALLRKDGLSALTAWQVELVSAAIKSCNDLSSLIKVLQGGTK